MGRVKLTGFGALLPFWAMRAGHGRPPRSRIDSGNGRWFRWLAALLVAISLLGLAVARDHLFPLTVLDKGTRAPYTIRATHDAVYDLHETVQEEAEEARQQYIPVYNKDHEILYQTRQKVLQAALKKPLDYWSWPAHVAPRPPRPADRQGGIPGAADPRPAQDAGAADSQTAKVGPGKGDSGAPQSAPASQDSTPGNKAEEAGGAATKGLPGRVLRNRQQELQALLNGCFKILEPFYQRGVVADSEFPRGDSTIRIFYNGKYRLRQSPRLHRFSSLNAALDKAAAQFFFKTDNKLRAQVIAFILKFLPPNLTYAQENYKFITDISQVTGMKVVRIRRGEVLASRGQQVDTRAFHAIKAAVTAATSATGLGSLAARGLMLVAMMLLFVVTTKEVCAAEFRSPRSYLVIFSGMVLLVGAGGALLLYLPMTAAALPLAALALAVAVVLGRGPGILTGISLPFILSVVQVFDLSTMLVGVAGGITAAITVRRRRRRSTLSAGVLVGVVQALIFEACRYLEGRPRTYAELWSGGETFLGGIAAGALALMALPFIERVMGQSSRGKLKLLTDFDHPLVRMLRERVPGTFAHTVNLINMVEMAVEAVGGDRLLARAGTLFHDLGKMAHPDNFVENQGLGPNVHDQFTPEQSAQAIISHVRDGLAIAREHALPPDVAAFIPEHHGTTGVGFFLHKAREEGREPDEEAFHYPGPKPRTVETAILMIADTVEAASRTLAEPTDEALVELVDRTVFKKFSEFQFEDCGITQGQLEAIKAALVKYLKGALHRRVVYPKD